MVNVKCCQSFLSCTNSGLVLDQGRSSVDNGTSSFSLQHILDKIIIIIMWGEEKFLEISIWLRCGLYRITLDAFVFCPLSLKSSCHWCGISCDKKHLENWIRNKSHIKVVHETCPLWKTFSWWFLFFSTILSFLSNCHWAKLECAEKVFVTSREDIAFNSSTETYRIYLFEYSSDIL